MPETPIQDDERTNLWRVLHGAEAVDCIKDARDYLAAAGGFSATLNTLDSIVTRIRADTGYPGGDPSGDGE